MTARLIEAGAEAHGHDDLSGLQEALCNIVERYGNGRAEVLA
jgi:hypothetical protein